MQYDLEIGVERSADMSGSECRDCHLLINLAGPSKTKGRKRESFLMSIFHLRPYLVSCLFVGWSFQSWVQSSADHFDLIELCFLRKSLYLERRAHL
jgi:hypothetical protein